MAIRGESFEPGGCSACPTSPAAAATMRAPAPAPPPAIGAVGLATPTAPGPTAFWSIPANEFPLVPVVAAGGCAGALGANADSSAAMRARAASMLTSTEGIGGEAARLEPTADRRRPTETTPPAVGRGPWAQTQKGRPPLGGRPVLRLLLLRELAQEREHALA